MTPTLMESQLNLVEDRTDTLAELLRHVEKPPPGVPLSLWTQALAGPLQEFIHRPGKQFRGKLVTLAWQLAGQDGTPPPELSHIVELLHAGSLIIDDIQDDSLQRRGRSALHRLIGLPLALNLGNWLYFWPLNLFDQIDLSEQIRIDLQRQALQTVQRCHEGQAIDLGAQIGALHPSDVYPVVLASSERKTGSLLALSAAFGAIAAEATAEHCNAIMQFGEKIGVALQMQNDLAELTGAAGPLKHPEDLVRGRVTWPWAWASERLTAARFDALQARGESLSMGIGNASSVAAELLSALGTDPSKPVRDWLNIAYAELQLHIPDGPAMQATRGEIDRLQYKYASSQSA